MARLFVSKMKSEVKNLVHKATLLEQAQNDGLAKVEVMQKDLSESKLLIGKSLLSCVEVYFQNLLKAFHISITK